MSPAAKTLAKIAQGVTRDLYRVHPRHAEAYLARLRATAQSASLYAQSDTDHAYAAAKWAEVEAAEVTYAQLAGGAS